MKEMKSNLAFGRYEPLEGKNYDCYSIVPNLKKGIPEYVLMTAHVKRVERMTDNIFRLETAGGQVLFVQVI